MRVFGGSALTQDNVDVPKKRSGQRNRKRYSSHLRPRAQHDVPGVYTLAWAEVIPASDIFLGVNAIDYSGYPDWGPEFIEAFEHLANLATKAGVEGRRFQIHTPLIKLSKADIIRKAVDLGVDLSLTHSCYNPTPRRPRLRRMRFLSVASQRFSEAGIKDPIRYAK